MSFRSRSRNIQPIVARPRSHSSSRVGSNGSSQSYFSSPSYTSSPSSQHSGSHRAIGSTSSYYPSSVNSPSYQSAYSGGNSYGSRDVLYSPTGRNGFFNSRDPYGSTSSLNTLKSSNSGGKYGGSVNSIYPSSHSNYNYDNRSSYPYSSSHFDNGVTTASLNIPFSTKQKNEYTKSPNMYHKSINSYPSASSNGSTTRSSNGSSSRLRDYTPVRNSTNLLNLREYSGSNPTLNSFNPSQLPSQVGRSQSLRDHERKSRTRNRRNKANGVTSRALSVTSEKSDGYEVRI